MRIAVFFFLYFLTQGILQPYLPPYYKHLGFSGEQLSTIVALGQFVMIVGPPFWGFLADRSGKPVTYLRLITVCALLSFLPMFWAKSAYAIAAVVTVYSLFNTSVSPMADTVAMSEARRMNTVYGRLRLWGSIGFIVAVFAFGELSAENQLQWLVPGAAAVMLAYVIAAYQLEPLPPTGHSAPSLADAGGLLAQPAFFVFLLATMMHWVALQPFYLLYPLHMKSLHFDQWLGKGIALGVCAEVAMMWASRSFIKRLPIFGILALALLASSLRWYLTATLREGWQIAGVQIFHGLSFGAFYVCSIAHLERAVPERQRATGRALFSSIVLGLGGIIGTKLAGKLYDLAGASALDAFFASSAIEFLTLIPLGIAAWLYVAQSSGLREKEVQS
jgi:PPP family 3-phenylpropionic acid transporter